MNNPKLLSVRNLCKHFPIHAKGFLKKQVATIKAVDNISFDLMPGKTLGLVGESGCGKTTAGRAILRAIQPTSGEVIFNDGGNPVDLCRIPDRELKPLRTKMQMIFQDPYASLNPRMTVGQIVAEPMVIHNLAKGSELDDRVVAILRKVGLKPEHKTRYPHAFSGGQRQRIGIARALIMHPSLVVCDEAVSALDVSVQAQVINLLQDLQQELGLTYIFIAHNLGVVKHICNDIAVMYTGRIVELGPTSRIFTDPRHPYTRGLLSAIPSPDPDVPMSTLLSGEIPDISCLPAGCSFQSRCRVCTADCTERGMELEEVAEGHYVACRDATRG
jgi:peptide/nickel transport system ATP-binding protein